MKCNDGKCYLNVTIENRASSCSNTSLLTPVGYWNPVYPSQDYWKFVSN